MTEPFTFGFWLAIFGVLFVCLSAFVILNTTAQGWLKEKKDVFQPIGSIALALMAVIVSAAQLSFKVDETKRARQDEFNDQRAAYSEFWQVRMNYLKVLRQYPPDIFEEIPLGTRKEIAEDIQQIMLPLIRNPIIYRNEKADASLRQLVLQIFFLSDWAQLELPADIQKRAYDNVSLAFDQLLGDVDEVALKEMKIDLPSFEKKWKEQR